MNSGDLFDSWQSLDSPEAADEWVAQRLEESAIRVARTFDDGAALLIPLPEPASAIGLGVPLQTTHIEYRPKSDLKVRGPHGAETDDDILTPTAAVCCEGRWLAPVSCSDTTMCAEDEAVGIPNERRMQS